MKALLKRASQLAVCCMLFGGLVGCSDVSSITTTFSLPPVQEARQTQRLNRTTNFDTSLLHDQSALTIGILSSKSAPNIIQSTNSQAIDGYDVDMALALADQLGVDAKFQYVSNTSTGLAQNCDIIFDVSASELRDATLAGTYTQSAIAVFGRGSTQTLDITSLQGKQIGVQSGSSALRILNNQNVNTQQTLYTNLNEAFSALQEGSIDYVVCDANAGAYLASAIDNISFAGILSTPEDIGVAVASTNSQLQTAISAALSALQTNGVADLVHTKWFGNLPALTEATKIRGVTTPVSSTSSTTNTPSEQSDNNNSDNNNSDDNNSDNNSTNNDNA